MRRASFWFTATTVETVPTATHNTTLSPASRALERGRSVRQYPTHVPDPLSSFAHAVWRFLLRRAAGRYAEHDLSDGIGANSCPCAFHWLCYLLGQPRLSESFSRGAPRGSLWVRQGPSFRSAFLGRIACPTATTTAAHSRHPRATSTLLAETAGQRRHRELVLRFLREISPQESISARHKTTKRGRHGSPHAWAATKVPSCGPDPAIAARAANLRAVPPQKVGPVTVRGENPSYISESYKSYRVLV